MSRVLQNDRNTAAIRAVLSVGLITRCDDGYVGRSHANSGISAQTFCIASLLRGHLEIAAAISTEVTSVKIAATEIRSSGIV